MVLYMYCMYKLSYNNFEAFLKTSWTISDTLNHIIFLQVRVRASDLGNPPRSQETVCKFTMQQNFATPIFDRRFYSETIPETYRVGTDILTVHANDADSGVSYSKFLDHSYVPCLLNTGIVVTAIWYLHVFLGATLNFDPMYWWFMLGMLKNQMSLLV